jgi:hypothetical protein
MQRMPIRYQAQLINIEKNITRMSEIFLNIRLI